MVIDRANSVGTADGCCIRRHRDSQHLVMIAHELHGKHTSVAARGAKRERRSRPSETGFRAPAALLGDLEDLSSEGSDENVRRVDVEVVPLFEP